MDISRYKKPIHFTCPRCRYDFEFNGGEIIRRKNKISEEISILTSKMQTYKNTHGKDKHYYKLLTELKEKQVLLKQCKQEVQIASEQSEIHLFAIFTKACMEKYGKHEIIKLLEECKDELCYNVYDTAIQDHNNFNDILKRG